MVFSRIDNVIIVCKMDIKRNEFKHDSLYKILRNIHSDQNLISDIAEYNDNWAKLPTIYGIAWTTDPDDDTVKNITFEENAKLNYLRYIMI